MPLSVSEMTKPSENWLVFTQKKSTYCCFLRWLLLLWTFTMFPPSFFTCRLIMINCPASSNDWDLAWPALHWLVKWEKKNIKPHMNLCQHMKKKIKKKHFLVFRCVIVVATMYYNNATKLECLFFFFLLTWVFFLPEKFWNYSCDVNGNELIFWD